MSSWDPQSEFWETPAEGEEIYTYLCVFLLSVYLMSKQNNVSALPETWSTDQTELFIFGFLWRMFSVTKGKKNAFSWNFVAFSSLSQKPKQQLCYFDTSDFESCLLRADCVSSLQVCRSDLLAKYFPSAVCQPKLFRNKHPKELGASSRRSTVHTLTQNSTRKHDSLAAGLWLFYLTGSLRVSDCCPDTRGRRLAGQIQ